MSAGPSDRGGDRLQKVLARAGIASRRAAEDLIREGRVTINGRPAELGDRVHPGSDAVKVDGRLVRPRERHRYLVLNKPAGCVTTVSDPEGRDTVLDLVPPALRRALFPVGRLDYHSEGLLLLTTDGEFAEAVSHPRHGCRKSYEVKVKGEPSEDQLERLREGITIEGRRTAPAKIRRRTGVVGRHGRRSSANTWWVVELAEGRTRQIREMFRKIGHPVQRLRRVAIGPLRDRTIPLGTYRELTEEEVAALGHKGAASRRDQPSRRGARSRPRRGRAGDSR
ncbi:MAG TPA: pseudouridine synthase [Thermoanaerobaculia bacterium]|nr:pseudouridine synthase [Thermoanaerobaculia bacterium]